jgi:hypothetical protein
LTDVKPQRSRTIRLARIMLAMSIVCAASGILMDVRVMGLFERAGKGEVVQAALERADEIATLLLFFTLAVNLACALAVILWAIRLTGWRGRVFAVLAALAIPLGNPVAAFLVRGYEDGLTFAIVAKALDVAAAVALLLMLRRRHVILSSSGSGAPPKAVC